MRFSIGMISRVLVFAGLAALAGCGGNGHKIDTSTPGANPGDNTVVAPIPEPAAPDTAKLTPSDRVYVIPRSIYDDYQLYLSKVGRIGNGYYMITEDGLGAASWACGDALCGQTYNGLELATKQCRDTNPGKTCIVFAKDSYPQVKYEIAP